MKPILKNLGKVCVTTNGAWDISKDYDKISIVIDETTGISYISKQYVPIGMDIENTDYWQPLFKHINNLVNLSDYIYCDGAAKYKISEEEYNELANHILKGHAFIYSKNCTSKSVLHLNARYESDRLVWSYSVADCTSGDIIQKVCNIIIAIPDYKIEFVDKQITLKLTGDGNKFLGDDGLYHECSCGGGGGSDKPIEPDKPTTIPATGLTFTISPVKDQYYLNDVVTFTAVPTPSNTTDALYYNSSNYAVEQFNGRTQFTLTLDKLGSDTVTATCGSISKSISFNVVEKEPDKPVEPDVPSSVEYGTALTSVSGNFSTTATTNGSGSIVRENEQAYYAKIKAINVRAVALKFEIPSNYNYIAVGVGNKWVGTNGELVDTQTDIKNNVTILEQSYGDGDVTTCKVNIYEEEPEKYNATIIVGVPANTSAEARTDNYILYGLLNGAYTKYFDFEVQVPVKVEKPTMNSKTNVYIGNSVNADSITTNIATGVEDYEYGNKKITSTVSNEKQYIKFRTYDLDKYNSKMEFNVSSATYVAIGINGKWFDSNLQLGSVQTNIYSKLTNNKVEFVIPSSILDELGDSTFQVNIVSDIIANESTDTKSYSYSIYRYGKDDKKIHSCLCDITQQGKENSPYLTLDVDNLVWEADETFGKTVNVSSNVTWSITLTED